MYSFVTRMLAPSTCCRIRLVAGAGGRRFDDAMRQNLAGEACRGRLAQFRRDLGRLRQFRGLQQSRQVGDGARAERGGAHGGLDREARELRHALRAVRERAPKSASIAVGSPVAVACYVPAPPR